MMRMKLPIVSVVWLVLLLGTNGQRLSPQELRAALSQDPMFSHQRDRAVPVAMNVNVVLPVNDPIVQDQTGSIQPSVPDSQMRPDQAQSRIQAGPVVQQNRNTGTASGVPSFAPVQQQGNAQIGPVIQQNRGPIFVEPPVREQDLILGQVPPTKIAQTQPTQAPIIQPAPVNDRTISNLRPAAGSASLEQQAAISKVDCAFQIPQFLLPNPDPSQLTDPQNCPSFLLPGRDINPELVNLMVEHWAGLPHVGNPRLAGVRSQITQIEFEQKCLIPALRAHVLGGPSCRTRELKVYLEWLLYLRQKLFGI